MGIIMEKEKEYIQGGGGVKHRPCKAGGGEHVREEYIMGHV